MICINYFKPRWVDINIVDKLIDFFEENNKTPEEFYLLDVNKKYEKKTKEMVTKKVSEFVKEYINGKLDVKLNVILIENIY